MKAAAPYPTVAIWLTRMCTCRAGILSTDEQLRSDLLDATAAAAVAAAASKVPAANRRASLTHHTTEVLPYVVTSRFPMKRC